MTTMNCLSPLIHSTLLAILMGGTAFSGASLPPIAEIKEVRPKMSVFDMAGRHRPLVIRTEKDAEKFFGKELVNLKKHVDFDQQFVLLFAWKGSGQDRMRFDVLESFPEQVRFQLIPGRTRDRRPHVKIYALRSNVRWQSPRTSPAADAGKNRLSYVTLTAGIVGGFVPAHVRQRVFVVRRDEKHEIHVMHQPTRGDEATYRRGTLTAKEFNPFLQSIRDKGLFGLPVESPPGCEDIYRLDTSVAARLGETFWRNGGPAGCVRGQSKVQPTEKQREAFREVVELINDLASRQAKTPSDAETFRQIADLIDRDAAQSKPTVH